MTDLEVLQRLRDEWTADKWCTAVFARDANGAGVLPSERVAVRWCLEGYRTKLGGSFALAARLRETGRTMFPHHDNIMEINDHLGHEAVMQVVTRLIDVLKQEEGLTR